MSKYKDWNQFKEAMELQNQATRALLRLRSGIVRELRDAIPEKEKAMGDSCCVVVSLSEIRTIRSLSPTDYLVKTQVQAITDAFMKCRTAEELQSTLRTSALHHPGWEIVRQSRLMVQKQSAGRNDWSWQ